MSNPIRVLIVDGENADAEFLALELSRGGFDPDWYRVETADQMRTALTTSVWDVVLADYSLPGFGAGAALAVLREQDAILPLIVVSGIIDEDESTAMVRAAANDYLYKDRIGGLSVVVDREIRAAASHRARLVDEQLSQDVLDSLSAHVAVLDSNGIIIRTNDSWKHFAQSNGAAEWADCGIGADYLKVCETAVGAYSEEAAAAAAAAAGIRMILRGERSSFCLEYPCHSHSEQRWFLLHAAPLRAGGKGAVVSHTDITERKSNEAAAQRLADIIQSTQDAIIGESMDQKITSWNPAAERLCGWSAAEAIGQAISLIVPPECTAEYAEARERVEENEYVESFDFVCLHRDGTRIDVAITLSPIQDESGRRTGVSLTMRDIREQRQAQALFQALVESAPCGLMLVDSEGHICFANVQIEEMFGYSRSELIGEFVELLVHEPLRAAHAILRETYCANPTTRSMGAGRELMGRRRDGSAFAIEIGLTPLKLAKGRSILCVVTDITERSEEARELRQFRALLESVEDYAIYPLDAEGRILSWNKGAERIFGYRPNDVLGKHVSLLRDASDLPIERASWEYEMAARTGRFVHEHWRGRRDGTRFWASIAITAVLDENKTPKGFVEVIRDLTERRLAEEDRQKMELQLRQSQKFEAMGSLAGGIAHDFNNILCAIINSCDLALDALEAAHPAVSWILTTQKAADQGAALTRKLLAFARRQRLVIESILLNDVVRDSVEILKRLLGENIRVAVQTSEGLPPILADAGQLHQVLMNLAVNARDAMPNGGELRIATDVVELATNSWHGNDVLPGPHVRLTISDTGDGMDDLIKSRLFEPFFTTKPAGKGTGLGLATVQGIVKQLKGHISVESKIGAGTTFFIFFPAVSAAATVPLRLPPIAFKKGDQGGAEQILIVEDDETLRNLMYTSLKSLGYDITVADCAGSALEICRRRTSPFDLVLTDIILPGQNGRQLIDALKSTWPGIQHLFISGYTDEVVLNEASTGDRSQVLRKPFTRIELANRIREVLDTRQ